MLIELEKAAEDNPHSFWKTFRNASDEINNTNPDNTPKGDGWFNHFSKLHCNQSDQVHYYSTYILMNYQNYSP